MEADFPVHKVGSCVVITLNRDENMVNTEFVTAMNKALDTAESFSDATCIVIIGEGDYFCLGLDLVSISKKSFLQNTKFLELFQKLLARLLTFPLVTVAALNGICLAGGAFVAICCDYCLMSPERGRFGFPEVTMRIKYAVPFLNIIKSTFPQAAQHEAIVLGRLYTAEEALSNCIVQEICPVDQLKDRAIATALRLAGKEGLDRKMLFTIKKDIYHDTYRSLLGSFYYYSKL